MFRIEERWPCPACQNKRTIRWGADVEHCFNCRHQWPRLKTKPVVIFSDAELRRLYAYRRAVRAGLYTDALP
jgi:ribosomal protein L37AE/L43A